MSGPYKDEAVDELFVILKDRRPALGMSLREIADATGTSKSSVSNWENLVRTPSFRNVCKWIKFLGMSIEISEDPL